MNTLVKTFEPNFLGRDFVIGDLHGSFPCFLRLLEGIQFDPAKDRMFSCGDLVDRGPDSHACLSLLRESWFHAVLSNHELMMLDTLTSPFPNAYWYVWMRSGGTWAMETMNVVTAIESRKTNPNLPRPLITEADYDIIDLQTAVAQLPHLITVKTKAGKKFHIVHAELPPTKEPITDEMLADPKKLQELIDIDCSDGSHFLWGRSIFSPVREHEGHYAKTCRTLNYNHKTGAVPLHFSDELSHIISGHTPLKTPTTVNGRTCIDTGAFFLFKSKPDTRHYLTCVELDTWTFYKATQDTVEVISPIVITKEDIFDHAKRDD